MEPTFIENNEPDDSQTKPKRKFSQLTKEKSAITRQVLEDKYMNQKLAKQAIERKKL